MHVLHFWNKLNKEICCWFILANLFNSLYLLVKLWWKILVANLATDFQDLFVKVKNLVTLVPVLGAISRPVLFVVTFHLAIRHPTVKKVQRTHKVKASSLSFFPAWCNSLSSVLCALSLLLSNVAGTLMNITQEHLSCNYACAWRGQSCIKKIEICCYPLLFSTLVEWSPKPWECWNANWTSFRRWSSSADPVTWTMRRSQLSASWRKHRSWPSHALQRNRSTTSWWADCSRTNDPSAWSSPLL